MTHPPPRAEPVAGPPPKRAPARPAPRRVRARRTLTPWLFLLAPLAFLLTFAYAPIVNMVAYSFTDWDGVSPGPHCTGTENYVQIVAALYFATVLSFDIRFRNFFKGVLFFPSLVNGVAIAFVFLYFVQDGGTLDSCSW